ncbi:MAG: pyridoxal phosphate-dependent aminotransferase [Spirochaetes bacterium]|nr:pyridoxal phosphate-dependent aminotransferase [Spirochaetota bacterium]MBU1080645.1 pyridoxal phosphate-dependent aminotransferase [Spirochaetota bacterium]
MRFSGRLGPRTGQNALSSLAARLLAEGRPLINISDSNPTRHGLRPEGVLSALSGGGALEYRPDPRGLLSARLALAERFGGEPSSYFLSASTSEAYSWLFKLLCDPGDAVLVPRPGYPLFDSLAGLEAVRAVPYGLEYAHPAGWSIDLGSLRAAATSSGAKAVVVINPNNPTGSYASSSEREAIVSLCAELGMALVADEVFYPYAIESGPGRSRLAGEARCLCFSLDGLSKLLCLPQMKLGWIRVSGPAPEAAEAASRLEHIADAFLSAGAPAMNALPALLGRAEPFVETVLARLSANLDAARAAFDGAGSPYRILRCDGGWTALLEYPRAAAEEATALGLLRDEGVFAQPGYFFDMERDGYLALSLILEPDLFSEAIGRIRRYIDSSLA